WRWTLCTLCCALPRQHTLCATLFPYATLFRSNHARPEPCHSGVLDRREGRAYRREVPGAGVGVSAAEREQPQEVRLARPVRAQHGDAVAEPDLKVEGRHESGEFELLAHDGALARAVAAQPHRKVLIERSLKRRPSLLELAQSRHGGVVAGSELVARCGLDLHRLNELLELQVL